MQFIFSQLIPINCIWTLSLINFFIIRSSTLKMSVRTAAPQQSSRTAIQSDASSQALSAKAQLLEIQGDLKKWVYFLSFHLINSIYFKVLVWEWERDCCQRSRQIGAEDRSQAWIRKFLSSLTLNQWINVVVCLGLVRSCRIGCFVLDLGIVGWVGCQSHRRRLSDPWVVQVDSWAEGRPQSMVIYSFLSSFYY